jgi:hypothetical protein
MPLHLQQLLLPMMHQHLKRPRLLKLLLLHLQHLLRLLLLRPQNLLQK